MNFKRVIKEYGYPLINKNISGNIAVARNKPNGKTAQYFDKKSAL